MAMKKQRKSKKEQPTSPKVHQDLSGFDIKINQFGEIEYTRPMEEVIKFLNKKVVDKKLAGRLGYKSDEDDNVDFMYTEGEDD